MVGFNGVSVGTSLSLTGVGANISVPIAGCTSSLASDSTLITDEFFLKTQTKIYITEKMH